MQENTPYVIYASTVPSLEENLPCEQMDHRLKCHEESHFEQPLNVSESPVAKETPQYPPKCTDLGYFHGVTEPDHNTEANGDNCAGVNAYAKLPIPMWLWSIWS
jgi:hypothetical protein